MWTDQSEHMQTLTTADQNIDLTKALYKAYAEGNIPFILDHLADDVSWTFFGAEDLPWTGVFKGRDEVLRFFQLIAENVEPISFRPSEYIAQNDSVVTLGFFESRAKTTGKQIDAAWCFLMQFKDDKAIRYVGYADPAGASIFRS